MGVDVDTFKQIIVQVVWEITARGLAATPPAAGPAATAPASGSITTITATATRKFTLVGARPTKHDSNPKEVAVAVSPALSTLVHGAIIGLPHATVLKEIAADIEEEGLRHRLMKVYKTVDVGFVAHQAAKLSDSGIGTNIQLHSTTIVHQRDLPPLSNVELPNQPPLIDLETFRVVGRNTAEYAKGESSQPMPIRNDQIAHLKYQAIVALLYNKETAQCDLAKKPQALRVSAA